MDTEKQKKKVLHFRKGDEHRVVIEKEKYADSIFSEQYKQSLLIWNRICNDYKDTGDVKSADENVYNVDGVSNIIAFCGDRGEGKTSCQMSFTELLHNEKERKELLKQSKMDITLACTKPFVMPLVDPLYFDQNHHLLDHVIGQLYSEIEETERNKEFLSKLKNNYAERKELLMQFQSVRRCLKQMEDTCDDSYDELEELSNRAASVRLHTEITLLFRRFLKYVKCDKLVIPIDDIDLNMSYGYPMVEDIRKYLCNPYCVLLLAVKIDQLTTVIQTRMIMDLQKISGAEKRALPMAQKYVTKLLPYENRVIMPTIADWAEWNINCKFEETEEEQELLVKDYVVQLIFDRTRYLFYNEKGQVSPIVPRSLRGLRQLLGMLESMKPYVPDEGPEQNKVIFKDYFYHEWVSCLTKEDQQFVQRLVLSLDTISTNKNIVKYIYQRLSKKTMEDDDELLNEIASEKNMAHNVSVGDVFYMLDVCAHGISSEEDTLLVFFIYSYYSICLYDIYDEISKNEETLHPYVMQDGKIQDDNLAKSLSEATVYRADVWYRGTNKLQRFVNGSMFTYNPGDFLPKEDNKIPRDRRVITLKDFNNDISAVNSAIIKQQDFDKAEKESFIRLELLAMFTYRNLKSADKESLRLDRKENDPYYLKIYTGYTNFLEFDILAPFTNAINIKYAYQRFEKLIPNFYNTAITLEWSLLRQMMMAADVRKNGENSSATDEWKWEHYLASNAIIRVSDVMRSLRERLSNRREANNEGEYETILQNVKSTIVNSGIRLYNRGEKAVQTYEINFDFIKKIYETLDSEIINRFGGKQESTDENNVEPVKTPKKGAKKGTRKTKIKEDK